MPVFAAKSVGVGDCSIPLYSQIANDRASGIFRKLHKAGESCLSHTATMSGDIDQEKNGGANHLRAWREERRMSREQLAAAIDPPTTGAVIWHLEEGERGLSAKWLRRIAPVLGITAGHLLDHDPQDINPEMLAMWSAASEAQRTQIRQLAETVMQFDVKPQADTGVVPQQLIDAAKRSKRRG